MSKFAAFSLAELRSLQNLLSSNIENVRVDCVSEDGENISTQLSDDAADAVHAETCLQESMLEKIYSEIDSRMTGISYTR